jgi:hypothetical protein
MVDVERVLIVLKCDVDKDVARRKGYSKGKRKKVGRVMLRRVMLGRVMLGRVMLRWANWL